MAEFEPKKSNVFPMWFYVADAGTAASAVAMSIAGEATATDVPQQPVPWAGSIVGMSVQVEAGRSAGTATVQPTINGSCAAASLTIEATNTRYNYTDWRRGQYAFTAGQRIGAVYTTTSNWTAAANPSIVVAVFCHVEQN